MSFSLIVLWIIVTVQCSSLVMVEARFLFFEVREILIGILLLKIRKFACICVIFCHTLDLHRSLL